MHAGITAITELAVKRGLTNRLPCWGIIANSLKKVGFSVGWVSALDNQGRTAWIVDGHRDGKLFSCVPMKS